MKKLCIVLAFLTTALMGWSQHDSDLVDSLMDVYVVSYEEGIVYFKADKMPTGQIFSTYKTYFLDNDDHNMVLKDEWTGGFVNMTHKRYQLEYQNLEVEGAQFVEHSESGYVEFINGKVAELDEDLNSMVYISEATALTNLLNAVDPEDAYDWAWEDTDWEQEIKDDTGDPTATYDPDGQGQLLWALEDYEYLGSNIPANKYTLAWKFDVRCLLPRFHKVYYIDAVSGAALKEIDLVRHDGFADILNHGSKTIDTKWRGFPYNNYYLCADQGNRNVRTKLFNNNNPVSTWTNTNKVTDIDDTWGSSDEWATAPHYFATETWDYFDGEHNWTGWDDDEMPARLWGDVDNEMASFDPDGTRCFMFFGTGTFGSTNDAKYNGAALDVVAHEFTHGINQFSSELIDEAEPGALEESFCDIFGELVEYHVTGSMDWVFGGDPGDLTTRSFSDPKSDGFHFSDVTGCITATGQPDTYKGENWYHVGSGECDNQGIHVNSGVLNHCFYLLAEGGHGINDNDDFYNVYPIKISDLEDILFHTYTNLIVTSGYKSARIVSIAFTKRKFGECSFQHRQVVNAWHAVGLGEGTDCTNAGSIANQALDVSVYPNPTQDIVNIVPHGQGSKTIEIFMSTGELIHSNEMNTKTYRIHMAGMKRGTYLVKIRSESGYSVKQIVKI